MYFDGYSSGVCLIAELITGYGDRKLRYRTIDILWCLLFVDYNSPVWWNGILHSSVDHRTMDVVCVPWYWWLAMGSSECNILYYIRLSEGKWMILLNVVSDFLRPSGSMSRFSNLRGLRMWNKFLIYEDYETSALMLSSHVVFTVAAYLLFVAVCNMYSNASSAQESGACVGDARRDRKDGEGDWRGPHGRGWTTRADIVDPWSVATPASGQFYALCCYIPL